MKILVPANRLAEYRNQERARLAAAVVERSRGLSTWGQLCLLAFLYWRKVRRGLGKN